MIVVSWNTRDLLRACLASVHRHLSPIQPEVLVVDNGSSDGSAEMVEEEFPEYRLIRNVENLGFGRANNQGMAVARGDFYLLLNSDAELLDDGVAGLINLLHARPELGVVGPKILLGDGRLQPSARRFPSVARLLLANLWLHRLLSRDRAAEVLLGPFFAHDREQEVDWIIGACMLVRRQVFAETGGFDPATFLYGEEVEWCRRIHERGWSIRFVPSAAVRHLDHQSSDQLLGTIGRVDRCLAAEDRLIARWHGSAAGVLAGGVRVAASLCRLAVFGARAAVGLDDPYGRDVRVDARLVLDHYSRRLRGRVDAGTSSADA